MWTRIIKWGEENLLASITKRGLSGLSFIDGVLDKGPYRGNEPEGDELKLLESYGLQIKQALDSPELAKELSLDLQGTDFQKRVWTFLRTIEHGQTMSYGEIASAIGSGPRAVASACRANPVAVIVPCHRVVGADGDLRGYRWGIARKKSLLSGEVA